MQQLLKRTAKRLRVRQAMRVLQSTFVETAVVVGYFRPVILLPVSALTGLPTAHLEAILAHELAHMRRHDYLVNLLQTLVDTVFFYHPAVWWLSNEIRSERENCCDDIAVAMLGNRVEYGRALLALEERRRAGTLWPWGHEADHSWRACIASSAPCRRGVPSAARGYVLTLGAIGPEARAAVPALTEALKDERDFVGMYAVGALGRISSDTAVPDLLEALKERGRIGVYAAEALWKINKHPGAIPALVEVLKDKDDLVRPAAAEALWQINRHPAAVPALLEALKHRDNWMSGAAAKALGRIGAEAIVAKSALTEALQDENEGVRTSAGQWLRRIDPEVVKKVGVK